MDSTSDGVMCDLMFMIYKKKNYLTIHFVQSSSFQMLEEEQKCTND